MSLDFTVIIRVRQRFGQEGGDNHPNSTREVTDAGTAPWVGASAEYEFECYRVDTNAEAILQFESLSVSAGNSDNLPTRNIIRINGMDIAGSITPGPARFWKTHSLVVQPGLLRERNSVYVESLLFAPAGFDNFVLDNMVVWYKTRRSPIPPGSQVAEAPDTLAV